MKPRPLRSLLRHSPWDGLLVLLALAQGAALLLWPSAALVGTGVWWGSNTVSHNFIHKPFFAPRWMNGLFSLYLSGLLGIPQALWRERHLAHHAERRWRLRLSGRLLLEASVVLGVWAAILGVAPRFFVLSYVPGYLAGLALCALHGRYEHARGTTSHYGRLYNLLFFNDGYHVEHHRHPGLHWRSLPAAARPGERASRWPAVLRWLDGLSLEGLERLALRSRALERFLLARHEAAFRRLLDDSRGAGEVASAAIVGGGLFPRTALVLRRLAPRARLVVIDRSAENLERARARLDGATDLVHATYDPAAHAPFDLVVVPLAYVGDREAIYRQPPAPLVLVHDWLWRPRGASAVVSLFLLKRVNLIEGVAPACAAGAAGAAAGARPGEARAP
ncbi:MAG: fatty acid desaturase [Planctomycetes bacterium]|nr:fatty acid desaturase [Planctomycetota bacterium]